MKAHLFNVLVSIVVPILILAGGAHISAAQAQPPIPPLVTGDPNSVVIDAQTLGGNPPQPIQTLAVPSECLSAEEAELVRLINEYRNANGLADVPASRSLTLVAQWHVIDLHENNPDTGQDHGWACNMHSWSDQHPDLWNPVCYTGDHQYASGMWNKPREITNNVYTSNGYENAYGSSSQATAAGAFNAWKNSPGHNEVILALFPCRGKAEGDPGSPSPLDTLSIYQNQVCTPTYNWGHEIRHVGVPHSHQAPSAAPTASSTSKPWYAGSITVDNPRPYAPTASPIPP